MPGLASMVISISGLNAIRSATPCSKRAIPSAEIRLGVPPPIKIECSRRGSPLSW
ncbi:Uncharacterised protein [Vibrio cholerae]|nr:Uncharacterised protein [Vibrio cholerae]